MRIHNPQITGSLEISSSASNKHYFIGANVGIGTINPGAELEIKGRARNTELFVIERFNDTQNFLEFKDVSNDPTLEIFKGDGQTFLKINETGDIFSEIANAKISGSSTSTGSFGHLIIPGPAVVGHGNVTTIASGSSFQINDTGGTSVGVNYRHVTNDVGKGFFQRFLASTDAGGVVEYGRIKNEIIGRVGGAHSGAFRFSLAHEGASTERLTILNNGKVGIGTTNPQEILDVSGSEPSIRIGDSAANKHFNIMLASGGGVSKLRFNSETHSNTLMVTNDNRVGMGVGSPAVNLHIEDSQTDTDFTNNSLVGGVSVVISNQQSTDNTFSSLQFIAKEGGGTDQSAAIVVESTSATSYTPKLHIVQRTASNTQTTRLTIDETGKVGIGTSSPETTLDVVGDVKIKGDLTAETLIISSSVTNLTTQFASGSTRFGDTQDDLHEFTGSLMISGSRIDINDGLLNTFLGPDVGISNTTGAENIAIGRQAMMDNTSGNYNIAIGSSAMQDATTATLNVAVGQEAMGGITTNAVQDCVAIGSLAFKGAAGTTTDANGTIAIGHEALNDLTSGIANVAVGYESLKVAQTSDYNTAVGYQTLLALNGAGEGGNSVFGFKAGYAITSGNFNTFLGRTAGYTANTMSGSVFIGGEAGKLATTGNDNIGIGRVAMGNATTTGDNNIAIGAYAGDALTSGKENVFVGNYAGSALSTTTRTVYVGFEAGMSNANAMGNTGVGWKALKQYDLEAENTAIGSEAMSGAGASQYCTAVGAGALSGATTSDANFTVAIGYIAGRNITSGKRNLAIGGYALESLTVGDDNIAIGYRAAYNLGTSTFANRNIAIGTYALLSAANNNINDNIAIGYGALSQSVHSDGDNNVAIGTNALSDLTAGAWGMVAVGEASLRRTNHADSYGSVAVGVNALTSNVSGIGNTAVGYNALDAEDDGDFNTAIGYQALTDQTGVSGHTGNTAVGYRAGYEISTGISNVMVGMQAGLNLTTSSGSVAIGTSAMAIATTGNNNIAIGNAAANGGNTTGDNNIAIGTTAGDALTSALDCVLIGRNAGIDINTGNLNTCIGLNAGKTLTSGTQNLLVGHYAGNSLTGTGNTFIGPWSGYSSADVDYAVMIGFNANGTGNMTSAADGTVAVGNEALNDLTSGAGNVAVGQKSLRSLTSGGKNLAIGYDALGDMTVGTNNIAVGYESMNALQGSDGGFGNHNIAIGTDAMGSVEGYHTGTEIDSNIAIGTNALLGGDLLNNNIDFVGNIAIGRNALDATGNAQGMTGTIAIGHESLTALTSGAGNTAVGYLSMDATDDGSYNTAVGYTSLSANCGDSNTCIGYASGLLIIGSMNTTIGTDAGNSITSGTNNVVIGKGADTDDATATNQTVVGYATTGVADNSVTLGNADVTDVYMASDGDATVNCGQILSTFDDRVNAPESGTGATVGMHISSSGVPYIRFSETNASSGDTADFEIYVANTGYVLHDIKAGATVYTVNSSQVISGDFNDTSDIGFKENIVSIGDGLSIISKLNPVTFDWKNKSKGTNSGFIAQEVEKILPNDVNGTDYDESLKDLPPATVDNAGKSINLSGIVAHLTKAVQELTEKVEAQQKEIEELKGK